MLFNLHSFVLRTPWMGSLNELKHGTLLSARPYVVIESILHKCTSSSFSFSARKEAHSKESADILVSKKETCT